RIGNARTFLHPIIKICEYFHHLFLPSNLTLTKHLHQIIAVLLADTPRPEAAADKLQVALVVSLKVSDVNGIMFAVVDIHEVSHLMLDPVVRYAGHEILPKMKPRINPRHPIKSNAQNRRDSIISHSSLLIIFVTPFTFR